MTAGRRNILIAAALLGILIGVYLKSVWAERWMPPGPPEVAGRILMERKRCLRCHTISGRGGEVGPNLSGVALRQEPQWLDAFIADPRAVRPKGKMPRPKLTGRQRAAVVAYLSTLQTPGLETPPPAASGSAER